MIYAEKKAFAEDILLKWQNIFNLQNQNSVHRNYKIN